MSIRQVSLILTAVALSACSHGSSLGPASLPGGIQFETYDLGPSGGDANGPGGGESGYLSLGDFMQSTHGSGFGAGGAVFDPDSGTITFTRDGETFEFTPGASGNDGAGENGNPQKGNAGWIFYYRDFPNAPNGFGSGDTPPTPPGNAGAHAGGRS